MFPGGMFPKSKKYWEYKKRIWDWERSRLEMKKKIIWRGILGFPLGITIGYVITIIISLIWADGYYMSCHPELISVMGNEMNAVLVQAVFCGLLGTGFAAASAIWEVEHWGIAKQTGIYFFVVSVLMMPTAYVTYWMEHSWMGFFSYYGIFILIFVMIWMVQFAIGKRNVKKLNADLYRRKNQIMR